MSIYRKILLAVLGAAIIISSALGFGLTAYSEEGANNEINLTVGENIVSNYSIDIAYYRALGADTLQYTYNANDEKAVISKTKTVDISENESRYAFSVYQAPAQLAEPVNVTLLDGENTVESFSFSAYEYCTNCIEMTDEELGEIGSDSRLKDECRAIIAYAKACQECFPSYMANEGTVAINDTYSELFIENSISYTPESNPVKASSEDIKFSNVSFICDSMSKLRIYLRVPAGFSEAPEAAVPEEARILTHYNGANSYIDILNIKPKKYGEKITLEYSDGASISLSVLDYAYLISGNQSETVRNFAKTLINYCEKSKVLFHYNAHFLNAVAAAEPTCTQPGNTAYYRCVDCGKLFSDSEGKTEITPESTVVPALGHDLGEWSITTQAVAPTCTQQGSTAVETRSCSRCDYSETRGGEAVEALGHDYQAVVTAPTCTEGGYTTYTCSRCNDSYTDDATAALGHGWGEWAVTTAPTYTETGVKTRTCARCGATETETLPVIERVDNIDVKLENVDVYLYRAGNANNIAMSSLFRAADETKAVDATGVSVTFTNVAGNAAGTFNKNSSDWTASTLKFTGTGVIKVTVKQYNAQAGENETAAELYLEVVAGTNYAEGATLGSVTSNNAVLLGNVVITNKTGMSINNGKTLYGNGFSVTDSRSDTGTTSGYINMSGNGSVDNAQLLGQVYPSAVTSGVTNQYYAPGVWITGNANIYNSYVRESKNAIQIDGGNVTLVNTTVDGGAVCNIQIGGGNVTLKDCVTTTSTNDGLKSLGIRPTSADCKINIEGTLTQYNWIKSSDLPSTYASVLSSVYNNSTYAYTYNGTKYVNMGIFFVTDASAITENMARAAVNDSTANDYGFIEKSYASITGTLYTAKASMGSADMMSAPAYSPRTHGQYYTIPSYSFNYTANDFTTDDKTYCTYNGTTGVTQISFEEGSSMNWNSSILSVSKLGNTLPYTVTMNNTDYTGQSIPFTQAGDYTVNYTYTDPYNYDKDGNVFSVTYTKSVEISVAVVEHGVEIYHPDFNYADIGGATASRQVEATVSGAKRIYVMPDVTATSSTIESKTVGGQTVYYPVVQVPASNSSGGNFSSGQLYYFAPAFKNINIVDYDQSNQTNKTAKYTYNSSTQKWPHNVSASSQPDTGIYYYTATNTSSNTNRPYGRSMNEQYYGYKYVSSRGGLCFASNQIEKENNANSQLVEFYYKGTDDVTYYYYIKYSFAYGKGSSGGCVADGSLVTMADGTQKPVEDVQVGDMVKTWSFYKGCYEIQPIVANMYHGTKQWQVLNLKFSDGSCIDFIYDHGLFDADLNTNVYINSGNVEHYIGDSFVKDGENETVTLTGYEITEKTAGAYAPLTAKNNNCYINGIYTICSEEECCGLFEHFEIGNGMKYDEAKMQSDIEKYGVYSYEDLSDCMSEEMFNAINAKYYKISAAKHGIERDEIARIFNQYM